MHRVHRLAALAAVVVFAGAACNSSSPGSIAPSAVAQPTAASSPAASAEATEPAADLLTKLTTQGFANMAVSAGPPFSALEPDGSASGLAPELTIEVLSRLGIPTVFPVLTTYGNAIPGMLAGRWDIIASALYVTPERCKDVLFSDPITGDTDSMMVPAGNPMGLHSYADVARTKARLGATTGDYQIQMAQHQGVDPSQISEFPDAPSLVAALKAGRIDAFEQGTLAFTPELLKAATGMEVVGPVPDGLASVSALAFPKDEATLRDAVNKALAEMKADGKFAEISKKNGFDSTVVDRLSTDAACESEFPTPKP